ncbi:MAG TPA: hypothetical protein EYM90_08015, partial [Phycisphaerales bacterium]|nr:hypothetical protein [Phycisphaerales bacterium]
MRLYMKVFGCVMIFLGNIALADLDFPTLNPDLNERPNIPNDESDPPPSFGESDRASGIFDLIAQFGDQSGSDMNGNATISQDFEESNDAFDVAAVDNFTVTTSCYIFDIFVGLRTFNGCDVNSIIGYDINIHSTLDSAQTSMTGNFASVYVDAAGAYHQLLSNGDYFLYFHESLGAPLDSIPILIPGEYWLSVVPVNNFSSNGQTAITNSTIGAADAFAINPNEGFDAGPIWNLSSALSYTIGATVAAVLRVPEDFSTIKDAVSAANDYDIIEVAPGVYQETLDISGKILTIISTHGPSQTTIQGDGASTTITAIGSFGLFSGFTVTGGGGSVAGGMLLYGSNIDIEHCIFAENHTATKGGGLGLEGSVVNFNDVLFLRNTSGDGGALLAHDSMVLFQDCSFIANEVSNDGGALYLRGESTQNPCWVSILGCDFIENEAGERGGAIACPGWYDTEQHRSNVLLWIGKTFDEIDVSDACTFERNKAYGTVGVGLGGAIYA